MHIFANFYSANVPTSTLAEHDSEPFQMPALNVEETVLPVPCDAAEPPGEGKYTGTYYPISVV